ncbi:T9SS type A sorting domain-containing protein [Pedobacter sp.]
MKNTYKILLLAIALFSVKVVKADDIEVLVKIAKENSKWVSFITSDTQKVEVSLFTSDGDLIHEQTVKNSNNKFQTYDLNALPSGEYVLKIESTSKVVTYQISVNEENAVLSQPVVKEIKRPVLIKKDNLLTLNLNGACKGKVELVIYNEYDEKLHQDTYDDAIKMIKKFDISTTTAKQLTFVLRSEGEEFSETIAL